MDMTDSTEISQDQLSAADAFHLSSGIGFDEFQSTANIETESGPSL